jgi:hypothetical protein
VYEYGLAALVRELASVSRVIHINEIPTFQTEPSCFLRRVRLPGQRCSPTLDRGAVEQTMSSYLAAVRGVTIAYPALRTIDVLDVLCTAHVCSQRYGAGELLYRDVVHLTVAGGRLLAEKTRLTYFIAEEVKAASNGLTAKH